MISDKQVTSKQKYKNLKRKLKLLLYEQECFLDELRKSERKMIKVQRDKNFLLDRLLQYERVDDSSGDSESTMSSGESDNELPSLSNSRTASASKQERVSPAAASGFGAFPFGGQPSMDLSPTSMLSSSMPGGMFGNMHQQGQFAPNASLNGLGGQRLVAGGPAVTRGRGRPRAGGQGGVTRGGGGRGSRGRGGAAGAAGLSSSSSGPGSSNSGGPGGTLSMNQPGGQGTPSRGNSSNGNCANNSSSNMPSQVNTMSLGSPTQGSSSMLSGGDLGSSVPYALFSPENSNNASFLSQPPSQSQQPQSQQRYTPQPPPVGAGPGGSGGPMSGMQQPQPGNMTPTGQQQGMMQFAGQQTPQQQQQQQGLMGPPQSQQFIAPPMGLPADILLESVMTHEDVERCLESTAGPDRFLYERIPGDLPADIFSENSEDDGVGGIGNSVSSEA